MLRFSQSFVLLLGLSFSVFANAPGAFSPFVGEWKGALEYQDYRGSGRVKVPVVLKVRNIDANRAAWDFDYDDFGKTVLSLETHSWDGSTYRVETKGQSEKQSYRSADFAALLKSGTGKAVLLGSEIDAGKQVEVRRTITLEANKLVTLKEVRPVGGSFSFRNQSVYTRVK